MKRILALLISCTFIITTSAYANIPIKTEATRENLLEDAVIDLLQPQIFTVEDNSWVLKLGSISK